MTPALYVGLGVIAVGLGRAGYRTGEVYVPGTGRTRRAAFMVT